MTRDAGARAPVGVLVVVVAVGIGVRVAAIAAPGFPADVGTFMAWAERLAERGPWRFYEPGYFADYPPGFLYVLWAMGALLDGDALRVAVKAASIPFDVGIALLAAWLARRAAGPWAGVLAAGLWMLSPAGVLAGAYWGQVDAVGTLPLLGALVLAGSGRWGPAGAMAALAAMIKPQHGLGLIVVAVAAAVILARTRDPRPVLVGGLAALATILALGLPFRAGPLELIDLVRSASETYPYTSLFAFNPWSVYAGFWRPDDDHVRSGAVLLALGIAAACVPLWWRRDTAMLLVCTALAVMAFYFLPTRVHERYLYPLFALLLPLAVVRPRLLGPYVALALCFFVTIVYALQGHGLLVLPAQLRDALLDPLAHLGLTAAMVGLSLHVIWRLARGDTALRADRDAGGHAASTPPRDRPDPPVDGGPMARRTLALPAGLAAGRAPTRRDLIVALLVALAVLATRGHRLDHPQAMYFDEVYHARTAFELLAERDPYEWTHPPLAKQIMALGILAFANDRVVGAEQLPAATTALAVGGDGTRAVALTDGRVVISGRDGAFRSEVRVGPPVHAIAIDRDVVRVLAGRELISVRSDARGDPIRSPLTIGGRPTALAAANGVVAVASDEGIEVTRAGPPLAITGGAVALTLRADGSALYAVDGQGVVRIFGEDGAERATHRAAGPVHALAHAPGGDRLFVARADRPALEVIELDGGRRETVPLANARTGRIERPATALALVPRSGFLYALAGERLVVIEPHGASPYASLAVRGSRRAIDGEADRLLVADDDGRTEQVATGRQAFAWRLPGVVAGALLALFIVLLARRLFRWPHAPLLAGLVVLLDGSMFAQARIGMNDVYVALLMIAGWYFVVAAHAPRRSATLDLLIAGALFGLATAAKWVAFYALVGLGVLSLLATLYSLRAGRRGDGGPLDLLRRGGLNAPFLALCFVAMPLSIYALSYVSTFGGPTIPFGWDLRELTEQMYSYHSRLTAAHPAGSPWWSWPLVLKPVYWYFGASDGAQAVIYDAGNVVLFWAALPAVAWCAVAAVRARSVTLGLIVFALAVQIVAWIPITRVVFFYHFFTALPWYLLALVAALVAIWESGRTALVKAYLAAAAAAALFFYPFVSGLPIPAQLAGVFYILPTWQYDCQFYPVFRCDLTDAGGLFLLALVVATAAAAAWLWASGRLTGMRTGG